MRIKKAISVLTALVLLALTVAVPLSSSAESKHKTIRVGWYDSSYNTIDENGYRTGYAYEYQLKLSAYNGWKYEYISGSWPDLLRMLEEGKIDLMSDVSYTEERAEKMLYSSLPMGTEEYYIFIDPNNEEISLSDKSTLNGKKIGVNRDSVQADFFKKWAEENGIKSKIIPVSCSEDESLHMLNSGELDAYVTVDSFMDPSRAQPTYKVGSSDFYFAVSKKRPDLLEDLEYAMNRIQKENRYYNVQMYEKYIKKTGASATLGAEEKEWLAKHKKIKVGYQDNYLAFCAKDEKTGEITGVMKDYLDIASDCIPGTNIEFEAIAYPTAKDTLDALKKGEIDCAFPSNLSGYDAEKQGTVMTPALFETEMYAVVRNKSAKIFSSEGQVIVAINAGNLNYEAFLERHYPSWQKAYYSTTEDCLKAVSKGVADCLIVSNYRINNISKFCSRYNLTTYSTGVEMDYCFAIKEGNTELYSILSRIVSVVPESAINASLSKYITEEAKFSLTDFIEGHINLIMTITGIVVLVALLLLFLNMRAAAKARKLISATETDSLTGLYNKEYFFQYADRSFREHPNKHMDAIVINIEQFHSVNALHGRDLGDRILSSLGNEIAHIVKETGGFAGRLESDEFDIYCNSISDYQSIFNRVQAKLESILPSANLRIRMGVMPWQDRMEPVHLFDRARTACNMARGHFNKHLIIYDESVNERESYEQRLVSDFRRALDRNEFIIHYQPKFSVNADKPEIIGAEALVRWKHPELGMIPPGDFVPLFEKNGQITLLDEYVWLNAAKQIEQWTKENKKAVPISVNLSRIDVFDPELESTLESIINSHNIKHEYFNLEVTESAYTEDADQVIQVMGSLRSKGFRVEMDDFGSGYSSLNMLSSMPIDLLKMDKEFIRNIENEEKDRQLVSLILDIAKDLKVPVIAEGVETEAQLKLIKELGCNIVQGYYFSYPLSADEFSDKFLENEEGGEQKK